MNLVNVKKQAKFYSVLALILLISLFINAIRTFTFPRSFTPTAFSSAQLLLTIPLYLYTLLTIVHALMLLRSVATSDSPFSTNNIRHLQWIGWLFVAYEPLAWVIQSLRNRFFPLTLDDGTYVTTSSSYGGVFLVSGLVVLAVATVFRYGMELQKLSDETL